MPALSPKSLELHATFGGERFRFDSGTIIATGYDEQQREVTLKGKAEWDELRPNQSYRFLGRWTKYKNKKTGQEEDQFAFESFIRDEPAGRDGVVAYLLEHGEGLGFGISRANKLWEIFGAEAIRVLREDPVKAAEALTAAGLRMLPQTAEVIAANLIRDQRLEACRVDLLDLLPGYGFPKAIVRQALGAWGNKAAHFIRHNPYKLMQFSGGGFLRCDAMYRDLRLPLDALKRQALCGWFAIDRDQSGHTWYPAQLAVNYIRQNITGTNVTPPRALKLAVRAKYLARERTHGLGGDLSATGDIVWLAKHTAADNEQRLAALVARALREPAAWPDVTELLISPHQREQAARAMRGSVGILGGGPGTGKTFTAAAIIGHLLTTVGFDNVLVGAPTGKAAVRVTENLAKAGLSLRARTWHSHLGQGLTGGFKYHEFNKWPAKVIIGDETSMCDTDLFTAVMAALATNCLLLIVGDVNQLPPVGHGAPLRDLIAAGLPYGELTEIRRASGGIVEACAAIREERAWGAGDNLRLLDAGTPTGQIQQLWEAIRVSEQAGYDPIWDCQVVVPINRNSPVCRRELNKLLQAELNPDGETRNGAPFRVGDKIVNTENRSFPVVAADLDDDETKINAKGEVYVANGEIGRVIDVQDHYTVVDLDSPRRTIKVLRGASQTTDKPAADEAEEKTNTGCSWDLAYALSVHKAQGSEFPVTIVILDEHPGAKRLCDRAWLYTAISRAKEWCYLVGRKSTADQYCRVNKIQFRKTFLRERILRAAGQLELGDL